MVKKIIILCLAGLLGLVIGAAVAQQAVPELIELDGAREGGGTGNIYQSIFSGPIKFTHVKHVQHYGATCGDCHHDSDFEPIEAYNPDAVYACGECHENEGLLQGPIAENNASREDQLAYRANALHMRCVGCHQMYNNLNQVVRVAESCKTCHARRPQDWVIK